jgi:uncharacterized protein YuzE
MIMNIAYDKIADALYIRFKEGKVKTTIEVADDMLHDLDAKGGVLGIEVLNASRRLSLKELELGAEHGIPLSVITATPQIA